MTSAQEIETELAAFLKREIFGPEVDVNPTTDLVAAGFDSMSLVKTMLHVETTYGFWIPEDRITSEALTSLRSFSETVSRLLHER